MQEKRFFSNRFGIIILIILQIALAFVTLITYTMAQNVKPYLWAMAMILVLLIPILLLKNRSVEVFFRWSSLYFAFIPASDLTMLVELPQKDNLLRIDFNLDDSLMLLSALPREIFGLMIVLGFLVVMKGYPWKNRYTVTIAGALAMGILMLILPEVSEILLYLVLFLLIVLTYLWAEKVFAAPMEKYERLLLWLVLIVIWARGCYRMLAILEVYPLIS